MAEVKKWSVTYTKHLKQKRKVYQDGKLQLLNNKVLLYDECEQLLDSKFVTKDEVVKPGESLTFASFLVDIGDPDTNCNSSSNRNLKSECDNKPGEKTQTSQREKLRNAFNNRKPNAAGKRSSSICLSPSQKIIREYKKNESLKYSAKQSPTPTSPAISSSTEWEALYTTQITQKAKKYHDGIIRMVYFGSHARQVILYDSCKNQLDKRFLKKEEAVIAGESLTFDAHLVDIGDPIGAIENDSDVKTQARSYNASTEKSEKLPGCQWQKPFIGNFVSHTKRSKESVLKGDLHFDNPVVKGQCPDDSCSGKRVNSGVRSSELEKIEHKKNHTPRIPLRDANQILSIMRKPTVKETTVENASRLSEMVQSGSGSQLIREAEKKPNKMSCPIEEQRNTEGNVAQSEGTNVDLAVTHESVSIRGSVILGSSSFKTPYKNQPTVGSSVSHGKSIAQDTSQGQVFQVGQFSVSGGETATHTQSAAKLPETSSNGKENTASRIKPKRLSAHLTENKRISVEIEASTNTSEYPSFDLGI